MTDLDRIRDDNMESVARRPLDSRLEKLLAGHIYLLRRLVHGFALVDLFVVNKLLTGLGFKFSYELSDHEEWAWFKDWKFPRYAVERKD